MKVSECKEQKRYMPPQAEALALSRGIQLLSTLSARGNFEDWELGDEAIDLEDGYSAIRVQYKQMRKHIIRAVATSV